VRFEERMMMSAEMSRCATIRGGGVEHTANVGTRHRSAVHADADEATRELIHDDEHPVPSGNSVRVGVVELIDNER